MISDLSIAVVRVGDVAVPLPRYQTQGSAGMDLHAALASPVVIEPFARAKIPTGIAIEIPKNFEAQVRPRSGLAAQEGITVLNSPGTIDSDYRGEIQVLLINLGQTSTTIKPMDRIAQLIIAPIAHAELIEVEKLGSTARGDGGYGSTG